MTPPFCIGAQRTDILSDPAIYRQAFGRCPALLFENVIAPDLLGRLMRMASALDFVPEVVNQVGTREIEKTQALGKLLGIMLARSTLWRWMELSTGITPIGGIAGKVAQTRPETTDFLDWHDDRHAPGRQLGVVIHLSNERYAGGDFELRNTGTREVLARFSDCSPGTIAVFAVRGDLEHRVTQLTSGGPRRVFAGWFLAEPEHPHHGVTPLP